MRPTPTAPCVLTLCVLTLCALALIALVPLVLAAPAGAQGRPRAPDGVPPNPFASNYPSRPPEAARPRPRRDRPAGAELRPPRDIPLR